MNLLLLKRNAFEHEQETRLFIVKKNFDAAINKGEGHIDIHLEWKDIIEGVRYDSKCSEFEKKLLEEELRTALGLAKTSKWPDKFVFKEYDVYNGPKPAKINRL